MIHVVAVITARPGKREAILQAFRANVPAVRAAHGSLRRQDQRHDREPQGSWGDA